MTKIIDGKLIAQNLKIFKKEIDELNKNILKFLV